ESIVDTGQIQVRSDGAGNMRILIPVDIKVGAQSVNAAAPPAPAPPVQALDHPVLAIEKVVIDQSNYAKRNGYDPKFLGAASVPLPKVTNEKLGTVFLLPGKKAELKYWNYSV